MEAHNDQLILYFAEQYSTTFQKYSRRLTEEQFKAQAKQELDTQYKFLQKQDPTKHKDKFALPSIPQIHGNHMRSIVDNSIYGIFCPAPGLWNAKHFWPVCYKEKVTRIFMLCANNDKYFPKLNQQLKFQEENLTVRCLLQEKISYALVRRTIIITGVEGQQKLQHLHFRGWMDGGVPEGEESLGSFRKMVQQAIKLIESKEMILVHCVAGVGRTGTFGAVIEAVRFFRKHKTLSLFQVVKNMRKYRDYCVQTQEQYRFAHQQTQVIA